MTARGRPPKPTALKLVQGNAGKRALNKNEPKPEVTRPKAPGYLNALAKGEWEAKVGELADLGLMTRLDVAMLSSYCIAWARWVQAELDLEKFAMKDPATHGVLVKTSNGNAVQNPLVGAANTAMQLMQRAAAEFGMSPSARVRLHVEVGEGEEPAGGSDPTRPKRQAPQQPTGPDRFFV